MLLCFFILTQSHINVYRSFLIYINIKAYIMQLLSLYLFKTFLPRTKLKEQMKLASSIDKEVFISWKLFICWRKASPIAWNCFCLRKICLTLMKISFILIKMSDYHVYYLFPEEKSAKNCFQRFCSWTIRVSTHGTLIVYVRSDFYLLNHLFPRKKHEKFSLWDTPMYIIGYQE